jgi:hypothetical protein
MLLLAALGMVVDGMCLPGSGSGYVRGQKISVKLTQFGPLGASCTIDDGKAYGLCTQDQIAWFRGVNKHELAVHDTITDAYVSGVTEKGRIDVSLKEVGRSRVEIVKDIVLNALEGSPSESIPVGDKSTPQDIQFYFYGVSKTEFKQAVGALYREGLVAPGRTETRLLSSEQQQALAGAKAAARLASPTPAPVLSKPKRDVGGRVGFRGGSSNSNSTPKTIFVGNLPSCINQVILRNTVVKVLGEASVERVRIPRRGEGFAQYGYVDLVDEKLVSAAVRSLKGVECMGRRLRTDFASRERNEKQL